MEQRPLKRARHRAAPWRGAAQPSHVRLQLTYERCSLLCVAEQRALHRGVTDPGHGRAETLLGIAQALDEVIERLDDVVIHRVRFTATKEEVASDLLLRAYPA